MRKKYSFYILVITLMACTKADIDYRQEPQGLLLIYPDGSEHKLPTMQYHFYSDDEAVECLVLSCDGSGNFKGGIPVGNYRVIAANTQANGVQFTGMDDHRTAVVRNSEPTRSGYKLLSQPENIYSVPIDWFAFSGTDTVSHTPTPVLLTKTVWINITLKGNLQDDVVGVEGLLPGVYPSVNLYSCEPTEEGIASSPEHAVKFQSQLQDENWLTSIHLFGLCNPEYGQTYENNLHLSLSMSDQSVLETEVELTDQLSDIIKESQGVIPLELSLHLQIEKVRTKLVATVLPWREGGSGDGDL